MSTLGMGNPQMPEGETTGSGDIVSFVKRGLKKRRRKKKTAKVMQNEK